MGSYPIKCSFLITLPQLERPGLLPLTRTVLCLIQLSSDQFTDHLLQEALWPEASCPTKCLLCLLPRSHSLVLPPSTALTTLFWTWTFPIFNPSASLG